MHPPSYVVPSRIVKTHLSCVSSHVFLSAVCFHRLGHSGASCGAPTLIIFQPYSEVYTFSGHVYVLSYSWHMHGLGCRRPGARGPRRPALAPGLRRDGDPDVNEPLMADPTAAAASAVPAASCVPVADCRAVNTERDK